MPNIRWPRSLLNQPDTITTQRSDADGQGRIASANAITAVEVVRISSMLPPLRKINLQKIEFITIMGGDE
jgi:hypothetical protein